MEPAGGALEAMTPRPRVTLGEPAWWAAAEALEAETGKKWAPPAAGRDYTLVRLALTLHPPAHPRDAYAEATLQLYLRPARAGEGAVVAHDLHPGRLTAQETHTRSVSLGPDLKFGGVDVSLLEFGAEIEVAHVYPVVQAFGLGQSDPSWRFARHEAHPLLGSQGLYALLDAPAGAGGVRLSLELVVTMETRFGLRRLGLPGEARAHLSRIVGGSKT
jgi:hypothetical protein